MMASRLFTAVLALSIAVGSVEHVHSEDSPIQPFPLNEGYEGIHDYCRETIQEPSEQLIFSTDVSLALSAAWFQVRKDVLRENQVEVRPVAQRADRFLGFVEGRLNIDLPIWWEEQLRKGRLFEHQSVFISNFDYPFWSKTGTQLFTGFDKVLSDRQFVVLTKGDESLSVKRELFREFTLKPERPEVATRFRIAGTIEKERAYFCFCGSLTPLGFIYCVDGESGEIIWRSGIEDGWPVLGTSGNWAGHYCEVFTTGDSVVVLGLNDLVMYLQVISKDDGKTKVKFATSFLES